MILFVRHGHTKSNGPPERFRSWSDLPLDEEGVREAQAAGKKILKLQDDWTSIYCSALQRTDATAHSIAHIVKPQTLIVTRQLLPWDLGELTGEKITPATVNYMRFFLHHADEKIPGGEAFATFAKRNIQFFKDVFQTKGNHVLVGHSRTIRLLLGWLSAPGRCGYDLHELLVEKDPVSPGGVVIVQKG